MEEFSFEAAPARAPDGPDGPHGPGTETEHKKLQGSAAKHIVINLMEQHQPSWLRLSPQKSVDNALAKLETEPFFGLGSRVL